jgi:3-oxoacyl-[acyl-carrier-protein] synthase-3
MAQVLQSLKDQKMKTGMLSQLSGTYAVDEDIICLKIIMTDLDPDTRYIKMHGRGKFTSLESTPVSKMKSWSTKVNIELTSIPCIHPVQKTDSVSYKRFTNLY